MARKVITKQPLPNCEDCSHSYDWNSKGANGKFILCRCPYYTEGKYCKFLRGDGCTEHFRPR